MFSSGSVQLLLELFVPAEFIFILLAQYFNDPVSKLTDSEK